MEKKSTQKITLRKRNQGKSIKELWFMDIKTETNAKEIREYFYLIDSSLSFFFFFFFF
jgi:hypothetical protein